MSSIAEDRPDGAPDSQDFWRLSELILELDAMFEEHGMRQYFERFLETEIDPRAITYMALQRALRLRNPDQSGIAAMWLEGFIMGRRYERRYPRPTKPVDPEIFESWEGEQDA